MPPNSGTDEADLASGDPPAYICKMDRRLIVLETRFDTILPTLATKTDLLELKIELREAIGQVDGRVVALGNELRTEMRDSNASLRDEMHGSCASLRDEMHSSHASLRTEMRDFKAEIHKWMTATMVTMFVGFGSMVVAILTLLRPA